MRLIEELNQKYNSVSIIGLAKNAGKTVTLNYLIEEAYDSTIKLGLTSTGRDGERLDLVTETEKPTIFVGVNTIIATAKSILEMGDAGLEILETTEFTSPLGNIVLCRVKAEGNVQLAGPSNASDTLLVKEKMIDYGADLVLIDGAIDRKAVASPRITDACIIATGAVLSRDIKKVVSQTAYYASIFLLPGVEDLELLNIKFQLNRTCIIDDEYRLNYPEMKTSLGHGRALASMTDERTRYIYLSGAVTTSMLKDLTFGKLNYTILIDDGTQVFSDYYNYKNLKKKGLRLEVLNPILVEAITVNPIAPFGYSFPSDELVRMIEEAVGPIKVVDVLGGGV
ncbi:MAG: Uncharacterized protein XD91_1278 [Clostridiales bacterium 38_11]|nr:MAG: Uncharacterized protein XD91_1278 [Clostridiales bacterium 38_11]HBH12590.1 hypothetical protein [Clostridiales bacterium]